MDTGVLHTGTSVAADQTQVRNYSHMCNNDQLTAYIQLYHIMSLVRTLHE